MVIVHPVAVQLAQQQKALIFQFADAGQALILLPGAGFALPNILARLRQFLINLLHIAHQGQELILPAHETEQLHSFCQVLLGGLGWF